MKSWQILIVLLLFCSPALAVEVAEITPANHDALAPAGKEADWIFGDYVLRNDKITAVIAKPIQSRNANMTVRNVAGALIDLTFRHRPSDQLSCFYPGGAEIPIRFLKHRVADNKATVTVSSDWRDDQPEMRVDYMLREGEEFITVVSTFSNPHAEAITFPLRDSVRADRGFTHAVQDSLYVCEDLRWRQAYGISVQNHTIKPRGDTLDNGRPMLDYFHGESATVTLEPGESYQLTRRLIPAESAMSVKSLAAGDTIRVAVSVTDLSGFVSKAAVKVTRGDEVVGMALTPEIGPLLVHLPGGEYQFEATGLGRGSVALTQTVDKDSTVVRLDLPEPGYVVGTIVDGSGDPIPAKVQFRAKDGEDPDFGADTESFAVKNLLYTANGRVSTDLAPGEYDIIVSRGNEYDAEFRPITVTRGETTTFRTQLKRVVDTSGWISSDFHSHSSPSGDNTSDQLGRVLNLLAEHIEFAPCTEHNRIDSYSPHLKRLQAERFMATCTGIELTGQPLPVNHQNAFPLHHHPHTQDGGGPTTHSNPIVQIERLANWDGGSEKLVQENHPLLEQIWADKNRDGEEDGGFERMFGFMDVMEVHPPADIFSTPGTKTGNFNVIQSWLRMLNKGYRIPGVVNTDAHYNFHGSGWLRNYIKSSTDEPSEIQTMEIVHQSERGHVVMTNGPYLEVTAASGDKSALPGDDLAAVENKVSLEVRVQCPNWLDINRVQVLINGRPSEQHNYTRRTTPDKFPGAASVIRFQQTIDVELTEDAHIIVATIGENLKLGPVMGPLHGNDVPVALINPIFVDVDGDGFKPNGDLLDLPFPYRNP